MRIDILRDFFVPEDKCSFEGRKSLPSIFVLGIILFLSIKFFRHLLFSYSTAFSFPGIIIGLFMFLIGMAIIFKTNKALLGILLLGLSLGLCIASINVLQQIKNEEVLQNTSSECVLKVLEDGTVSGASISCTAQAFLPSGKTYKIALFLSDQTYIPLRGTEYCTHAFFKSFSQSYALNQREKGLCAQVHLSSFETRESSGLLSWVYVLRKDTISLFLDKFGSEKGGFLAAILCGYRGALFNSSQYEEFQTDGLAHLVAVSGTHLVLISSLIQLVLKGMRTPKIIAIILQSFLLLIYLLFSGCSPSALRASLMIVISLSSFFGKRRPASLAAMGVILIALLVIDSSITSSLSLILSVSSTLSIVVFMPLIEVWIEKILPVIPSTIRELLALTLASSLISTPLIGAYFSQISLIAPLSNLIIGPLFPLIFMGSLFFVFFSQLIAPVGILIEGLLKGGLSLLWVVIHGLASVPFASIPVMIPLFLAYLICVVLFIVLWYFWPVSFSTPLKTLLCSFVILLVILAAIGKNLTDEIIMFDVGQGDSILIRSKGSSLLIDTGASESKLKQSLGKHHIYSLNGVLITHGDNDHAGMINELCRVSEVSRVFCSKETFSCSCNSCTSLLSDLRQSFTKEEIIALAIGDSIEVGNFHLNVIWPEKFSDSGGNQDSLSVVIEHRNAEGELDGFQALFTGDAEAGSLKQILNKYNLSNIDLLKVPHHGSKNALTEEVLEELRPSSALISVGAHNRYGHPSEQALQLLESYAVKTYRTDVEGEVICRISSNSVHIRTSKLQ